MAGNILLDTNVVFAILNLDPTLDPAKSAGASLHVSAITVGELHYGSHKSSKSVKNLERLEAFLAGLQLIGIDADTGRIYGRIRWQLRSAGHPIPDNDIWIAAIAIPHVLPIATRDAHLSFVDGLDIVKW